MAGEGFKVLAKLNGSIDVGATRDGRTDITVSIFSSRGSANLEMNIPSDTLNEFDIVSAVYGAEKTYREFGGKTTGQVYGEQALKDDRMAFPSVQAINRAIAQGNQNGSALRQVLDESEIDSIMQLLDRDVFDDKRLDEIMEASKADPELAAAISKVETGLLENDSDGESLDNLMASKTSEAELGDAVAPVMDKEMER